LKFENLALIPARGGSKSIPKKNLANLGGKPLLAYCLRAIRECKSINRIIVSTDDTQIGEAAKRYHGEIPFLRPGHLAQDDTSTIAVVDHALQWLEAQEGYQPDHVLVVQPTEPFILSNQIDETFELMRERNADSGITMVEVPRTCHPFHVRHETKARYLEFDHARQHYQHPNRQSDPKRYAFGNLYWFRTAAFLKEKEMEVGKRVGVLIDGLTALDINTPLDLEIAEQLLPLARKASVANLARIDKTARC
jgi:CMP-N-acetylneuraminic acid synthetase